MEISLCKPFGTPTHTRLCPGFRSLEYGPSRGVYEGVRLTGGGVVGYHCGMKDLNRCPFESELFPTIRNLHAMGFSIRSIAAATRIPRTTLQDWFPSIVEADSVADDEKLAVRTYKKARLLAMSMQASTEKVEIAALSAIEDDEPIPSAGGSETAKDDASIVEEVRNDLCSE